jgi:hypothetical protein
MVVHRPGQEQLKAKNGAGEHLGGMAAEPPKPAMQPPEGVLRAA